jgi:hypothetical protein
MAMKKVTVWEKYDYCVEVSDDISTDELRHFVKGYHEKDTKREAKTVIAMGECQEDKIKLHLVKNEDGKVVENADRDVIFRKPD